MTEKLLGSRRRFGLVPWLAASGVASFGVLLVVVEALHPATSLAQVATAQARQTQYTLINIQRFDNGTEWRITECRDGSRWSVHSKILELVDGVATEPKRFVAAVFGSTVMDGSKSIRLQKLPGLMDVAEIDGPESAIARNKAIDQQRYEFDLSKILKRHGGAVKSNLGVEWQGRKVDRFDVHSSYVSEGKTRTVDQTVFADPETHLPIRVEEYRDGSSLGSTWDYDYKRPSEDQFKVDIDPKTIVFDLPKQRADLQKQLTHGAIFVEFGRGAQVLFPVTNSPARLVLPMKVTGSTVRMQADLVVKPGLGKPAPYEYTINGKRWQTATLVWAPFNDFGSFSQFKKACVSVKLGELRLADVPVFHVNQTRRLLRPFAEGAFQP